MWDEISSPKDAEGDKVHDDIDAPNDDSDGAEDDSGHQVHLDILAHPEDNSKEGDNVGEWPDHGPDGVTRDGADDAAEGVDGPEEDHQERGVLHTEVEIKHEAKLLQTWGLGDFVNETHNNVFCLYFLQMTFMLEYFRQSWFHSVTCN